MFDKRHKTRKIVINLERLFINGCKIGNFLRIPSQLSLSSESTEFGASVDSSTLNLMMDNHLRNHRISDDARPTSLSLAQSQTTAEIRI